MARIKVATPFDSVQKKFSKTDEIHFKNRKADNATTGVRVKHPYDGGNSANQVAHRAKFALAIAAANTALQDAQQKATYKTAFLKQRKYITLYGYVVAQEYAKLPASTGGGE